MKISDHAQATAATEKFNHFHDGFIRRIDLQVESRSYQEPAPDAATRSFQYWSEPLIEIEICHSNYDYPHQPEDRTIIIRAEGGLEFNDSLLRYVQKDVFDLTFSRVTNGIECALVYHTPDAGTVHSMDNGTRVVLFVAKEIVLLESRYETQPGI